jgi:hypothetical protein
VAEANGRDRCRLCPRWCLRQDTDTAPRHDLAHGACLSVAAAGCDLVVGCGHGQFPSPVVHADGTFEVSGTYRIEVGPISIDPAPPAMFSGVLTGHSLRLTVTPSDPSLRPASYTLQLTNASGKCTVPCV